MEGELDLTEMVNVAVAGIEDGINQLQLIRINLLKDLEYIDDILKQLGDKLEKIREDDKDE